MKSQLRTITPHRKWLNLNLREIWQYKDLISMFVKRDFVTYYKQTILGPLWFFIQPIFTAAVNLFLFGGLANIGPSGVPGFLFYISGPIVWQYFQDCLLKIGDTFKANENIFGKVYFPRLIMPISVIISNLLKFGVQLGLLVLVSIYLLVRSGNTYVQKEIYILPLLLLLVAGLALGLGLIISSLTTKYRDIKFFVQFSVPILKYITPGIATTYAVFVNKLPKGELVALLNPIGHIIDAFNYIFTGAGEINIMRLTYSAIFMIVTLFLGIIVFNKTEQNFIDTI